MSLENSSILITGGTGSFGNTFVPMTLKKYNPRRLVIFSRDDIPWRLKFFDEVFIDQLSLEKGNSKAESIKKSLLLVIF
jgi:dTDP-D-glucose 4,6-dehydratase